MLVEIPRLNEHHPESADLLLAIITYVVGSVGGGGRRGYPYVVVLNRRWSYERIFRYIVEKGAMFMFAKPYFPLVADVRLLLQHSSEGVTYLEPGVSAPLYNECISSSNRLSYEEFILSENFFLRPHTV